MLFSGIRRRGSPFGGVLRTHILKCRESIQLTPQNTIDEWLSIKIVILPSPKPELHITTRFIGYKIKPGI